MRCPSRPSVGLDAQNKRLQVKAGKSRFNLQTLPAGGFSQLPGAPAAAHQDTLPQKAFKSLLLLVQYAMAQQDIRYYLNGMLLVLDGDRCESWRPTGTGLPMRAWSVAGR